MLLRTLWVTEAVLPSLLFGTALMLVGTGLGWTMGRAASWPPVRLITWWVRTVLQPLLHCRGWGRCAAAIFVNNASILATLVAIGYWSTAGLLAIGGLGISLGIGLRVLSDMPGELALPSVGANTDLRRRIRVGIALNLLEPPAIMLAVGLSLGRAGASIPSVRVWETFALWVVPLTLVAAGGEALWLGACRRARNGNGAPAPPRTDREPDP